MDGDSTRKGFFAADSYGTDSTTSKPYFDSPRRYTLHGSNPIGRSVSRLVRVLTYPFSYATEAMTVTLGVVAASMAAAMSLVTRAM